jgi:hypothetical protein
MRVDVIGPIVPVKVILANNHNNFKFHCRPEPFSDIIYLPFSRLFYQIYDPVEDLMHLSMLTPRGGPGQGVGI